MPTFISRRVDDALVFVSGTRVSGQDLADFLEEHRTSHPSHANATLWTAAELAAAFSRRFGERVDVRRFAFSSPTRGVAFHIRAVDEGWAERTAV